MKREYNHIFFDLDNTLWDFEKNSKKAMQITFSRFFQEVQLSFSYFFEIYSRINDHLWDEYKKRAILKKDLIYQRFSQTFSECNLLGVDPEEMNVFYLEEMAKQKDLKKGVLEVLTYLKKEKYNLHIITNGFKEVQYKKLESSGLRAFFTNVFISEIVKVPKPGYEIFEYAIKSSNAKKSGSLMVGDDWLVDIVGANKFGIDAVFVPVRRLIQTDSVNKDIINPKNNIYILDEIIELAGVL